MSFKKNTVIFFCCASSVLYFANVKGSMLDLFSGSKSHELHKAKPVDPPKQTETLVSEEEQIKSNTTSVQSYTTLRKAGRNLSMKDVEVLENTLKQNPEDLATRTKVLCYYFYNALPEYGRTATIEARRRHIYWLIEHHPEAEIAGQSEATLDPIGHALADKEGYQQAKNLWLKQAEKKGDDKFVLLHAAKFLQLHDKNQAEQILKKAGSPMGLGSFYALGILRINGLTHTGIPVSRGESDKDYAFAKKAREALEQADTSVQWSAGITLLQYGGMIMGITRNIDYEFLDYLYRLLKKVGGPLDRYYDLRKMFASSEEEKREWAIKRLTDLEQHQYHLRKEASNAKEEQLSRGWMIAGLEDLTEAAFEAGDYTKAEDYATKLLQAADDPANERYHGTATHRGSLVMGQIALQHGDIEKAKDFLIKAGQISGGGSLSSFGPNMLLAKGLLEKGEKETVIEYLNLCRNFWNLGNQRGTIDRWITVIKKGGIPNFGGNLSY